LDNSPDSLTGLSENRLSAPVGINPTCGILRVGQDGSISNIANIVVCVISILITVGLIFLTSRRKAAVGACHRCLSFLLVLTRKRQAGQNCAYSLFSIYVHSLSSSLRPDPSLNKGLSRLLCLQLYTLVLSQHSSGHYSGMASSQPKLSKTERHHLWW